MSNNRKRRIRKRGKARRNGHAKLMSSHKIEAPANNSYMHRSTSLDSRLENQTLVVRLACRRSQSAPPSFRHQAQARLSAPLSAASCPRSFALALIDAGILTRTPHYGKENGQWVCDDSLLSLLSCIERSSGHGHLFDHDLFEVRCCYYDGREALAADDSSELTSSLVILVTHLSDDLEEGLHFSTVIINNQKRQIHAFDTLGQWSDGKINRLLVTLMPNINLNTFHVHNHTGRLHQYGSTCGVWALWICFAYCFNYRGCRSGKEKDCIDLSLIQADVLAFWREATYDT